MEIQNTKSTQILYTDISTKQTQSSSETQKSQNYQQIAAHIPLNVGKNPVLTTTLNDDQLLKLSEQVQHDSEIIARLTDKKMKDLSEMSHTLTPENTLDISSLSSNAVSLIISVAVLLSALRTAETKLGSQLSLIAFDATKSAAENIVRQGLAALSSSITGAVTQVGITGIGAKKTHSGISDQKGALRKNLATAQSLEKELAGSKLGLNKQIDTNITSPQTNSSTKFLGKNKLAPDNISLSTEHKTSLSSPDISLQDKIDTQRRTYELNTLSAQQKQNIGRATMDTSAVAGNISTSGGRYASALEEEEQLISQASSKQAEEASQVSKEASQATNQLIQKLLNIIDNINQSRSSTASQIAGNIRA
ncbi:TPA: T3SS translocon subunit IpaC [Shigella dysenteriae]|nr:T3SS translocon subunit IpaC [Shigella dysenteriae]EFP7225388.1 T3SS translocon subunit IpaC [Shigella dysenteriae]EFP7618564.1 T3SS translocon subunit IpaC [Shigella dysenteriae]EFW8404707.1 IpaC/SipC family type III secretion system effector [Shigella dysenteriae]EFX6526920.1 IpaC/SipC family type III secretion system effector [Shigella dysenteriae]EFX9648836.1 IpaC/SipC family type III secretion system effector [Shigella dysenteriae]